MAGKRLHTVMPQQLIDQIDENLAPHQSRGNLIRCAIEFALNEMPEQFRVFVYDQHYKPAANEREPS